MPELPEVETVARGLKSTIIGHKILNVRTNWPKTVKNIDFGKFLKEVQGHVIEEINRKGKFLILKLSGEKNIVIHLRMTGNLLVSSCLYMNGSGTIKKGKTECTENDERLYRSGEIRHIHLVFSLNKNRNLLLMDIRKFATVQFFDNPNLEAFISKVGIDATDNALTAGKFFDLIKLKNKEIKKVLLDQALISGIGNIYADEILFDSNISPLRKTGAINKNEGKRIFTSMRKILAKAIELGGTSFSDFRNIEGQKGAFGPKNKIYQKEGKLCVKKCGGKIKKIIIAGRGTRYCPRCQK